MSNVLAPEKCHDSQRAGLMARRREKGNEDVDAEDDDEKMATRIQIPFRLGHCREDRGQKKGREWSRGEDVE